MKVITLLTDFGLSDGYTGVMKGVIYRIAPDVKIIDISHLVHPQNVREGSLILNRSYPFFPEGAVHVAVIDPGVGTTRRPIAARIGSQFFVCPDNGLITHALEQAEKAGEAVEIVHLNQPRFWLEQVSNVFHGRDIFSPVAAHLANGVALLDAGSPVTDPVRLHLPAPEQRQNRWYGEIIAVDHFGNLSTNFKPAHLENFSHPIIRIGGREIGGLVRTFGDRPPGSLVALIDSDGSLAIAVAQGSAARELAAKVGDPVEVYGGLEW
ncbi:MAG: SAM-dependent chlorinase/fluorinase [Anaerolineaceae bacterium]|nr:SAM-dependent chlorinase/fluorinase [Anaerolineaceae bacterium]